MSNKAFGLVLGVLGALAIAACQAGPPSKSGEGAAAAAVDESNLRVAVFAGGCFWCSEADFEKVPGVVRVVSGYTGGTKENPTYEEVSSGTTGHVEAIQVTYDPAVVTYEALLDNFWRNIDPTDAGGSFVDRGPQYLSVIFTGSEDERQAAEKSKDAIAISGLYDKPIVTAILPLGKFYPAEAYHQDFSKKNPSRYKTYRQGSGRDQFRKEIEKKKEK